MNNLEHARRAWIARNTWIRTTVFHECLTRVSPRWQSSGARGSTANLTSSRATLVQYWTLFMSDAKITVEWTSCNGAKSEFKLVIPESWTHLGRTASSSGGLPLFLPLYYTSVYVHYLNNLLSSFHTVHVHYSICTPELTASYFDL